MSIEATVRRRGPFRVGAIATGCAALLFGLLLAACDSSSSDAPGSQSAFMIYGSVTGLQGIPLTVRVNDTVDVTLNQDIPQTELLEVADGTAYEVVEVAPSGLRGCAIANGSGTVSGGDVTISIACALHVFFLGDSTGSGDLRLWRTDGTAAGTVPIAPAQEPGWFTMFRGVLYYVDWDSTYGNELWRYDGSNPPTRETDICPGTCGSFPSHMAVLNDVLYFKATDGEDDGNPTAPNGFELWRYDGVNAPTMVADLRNCAFCSSNPEELTVFDGALYFRAIDGDDDGLATAPNGLELWRYDGVNPPAMVADIRNGTGISGNSSPAQLTVFDGALYFQAMDGTDDGTASPPNGRELWKYDGTSAPTLVADLYNCGTCSGSPEELTVYNGALYFRTSASDANHHQELWKYDGVSAPAPAADICTGSCAGQPRYLTVAGGTLYFMASDGADNGLATAPNGNELWAYNGVDPPSMVADIDPTFDGAPFPLQDWSSGPNRHLAPVVGGVVFAANDGTNGEEPWFSDGTAAGTRMLEVCPGACSAWPAF